MERGRGRGRGRAAGAGSQPPWSRMLLFLLAVIAVLSPSLLTSVSAAIDCFKCVSLNGDNPACEDPFHNNFSVGILESPCMAGRKQREGLFPATACIKLAGIYADDLTPMIIRDCAVDSGSITLDTELSRMSHCGAFVLSGRKTTSLRNQTSIIKEQSHLTILGHRTSVLTKTTSQPKAF
ncbi:uncharacterized protein LOC143040997 isoform X3 [Oratosquilla oratoria]|uniref:uncharacterized protein LOC143040997 isoform X3 n=1 Tax=Oratosquilla oratoria TaxID=337810 RepID=UPI003F75AC8E